MTLPKYLWIMNPNGEQLAARPMTSAFYDLRLIRFRQVF